MTISTLGATRRDDTGVEGVSGERPSSAGGRALGPGEVLGRYRLTRQIGEGGMGAVFEAVHDDIGRRVAVKVLQPALAVSESARTRFFREARAAARVSHPNVVAVHDVDVDAGAVYLVMDLLAGETLARRLERGPLSPEECLAVLGPALDGVACAHEAGVVHRDLKPSNVVIVPTPEGERAVVVDFGVSRLVDEDSDLTGSAAALGTPAFMSPEQARGARDVGAASDQFSLGAVLYTALSGRRPFEGRGPLELVWNIQRNERAPLARLAPRAPAAMVAAVERAMAPDPAARFPSVRAFAAALRASTAPPRPRPRRDLAVVAGVALVVASLASYASTRARPPQRPPRGALSVEAPAARPASPPSALLAPAPALAAPSPAPSPAPSSASRDELHRRAPRPARAAPRPSPETPAAVVSEPANVDGAVAVGRNRAVILGR